MLDTELDCSAAAEDTPFVEFWNNVLAPKFIRFKHILVGGLTKHSEAVFPILPVRKGNRVLDVGCGDGQLLKYLVQARDVVGRGIELSQAGVNACVAQGLSVVQGDADADLGNYPTQAFDYVVLSQTLQATRNPRQVVSELVRIGRKAVISFPNFGFWRIRSSLLLRGQIGRAHV